MNYTITFKPIDKAQGIIYYRADVPHVDYEYYMTLKKIYITYHNCIDVTNLLRCYLKFLTGSAYNAFVDPGAMQLYMCMLEAIFKKKKCLITDTSLKIKPHEKYCNILQNGCACDIEFIDIHSDMDLNIQFTIKIIPLAQLRKFQRYQQIYSAEIFVTRSNYFRSSYQNVRFISFICHKNEISQIKKVYYTLCMYDVSDKGDRYFETTDIITKNICDIVLCIVPIQYIDDFTIDCASFSDVRKTVKHFYKFPDEETYFNSIRNSFLCEVGIIFSSECDNDLCNTLQISNSIYVTYLW